MGPSGPAPYPYVNPIRKGHKPMLSKAMMADIDSSIRRREQPIMDAHTPSPGGPKMRPIRTGGGSRGECEMCCVKACRNKHTHKGKAAIW